MVASLLVRLSLFFFLSSLLDSFTVFVFAAAHAPWEKHHLGRRRCQREPGRGRRRRGTPLTHSLSASWDGILLLGFTVEGAV